MNIDPRMLIAVGDVFLNLSAGWFGLAFITPIAKQRTLQQNLQFIIYNILFGVVALAIGYKFRTIGI